MGVVRVSLEPDSKAGEIAFVIGDQWQGLGLGTKMLDHTIEVCKDMGVETLYAIMLPDNYGAINLTKKMGFTLTYLDDGAAKGILNLKEEETTIQCPEQKSTEEIREAQIGQKEHEEAETTKA